eukprot:4824616-Amphidinium_carterae.1
MERNANADKEVGRASNTCSRIVEADRWCRKLAGIWNFISVPSVFMELVAMCFLGKHKILLTTSMGCRMEGMPELLSCMYERCHKKPHTRHNVIQAGKISSNVARMIAAMPLAPLLARICLSPGGFNCLVGLATRGRLLLDITSA